MTKSAVRPQRRRRLQGVDVSAPVRAGPKGQQRRFALRALRRRAAASGGRLPLSHLNALVVDELDADTGRLFSADLVAAGCDPRRLWSPNVKPEVVAALRALGVPPDQAVESPADAFLDRSAAAIRAAGGLHLAFVDVHGTYARGAGPLVERLADHGLLHGCHVVGSGSVAQGALLCFAASSRAGTASRPRAVEATAVMRDVAHRLLEGGYHCVPAVLPSWVRETYFTMQFHAFMVFGMEASTETVKRRNAKFSVSHANSSPMPRKCFDAKETTTSTHRDVSKSRVEKITQQNVCPGDDGIQGFGRACVAMSIEQTKEVIALMVSLMKGELYELAHIKQLVDDVQTYERSSTSKNEVTTKIRKDGKVNWYAIRRSMEQNSIRFLPKFWRLLLTRGLVSKNYPHRNGRRGKSNKSMIPSHIE